MVAATFPTVPQAAGSIVVWLRGDLDIATASALKDTLRAAGSAGGAAVIVDMSEVTFMDAAAIGALISCQNLLRAASQALSVRSPSGPARRVLSLCGLLGLLGEGR